MILWSWRCEFVYLQRWILLYKCYLKNHISSFHPVSRLWGQNVFKQPDLLLLSLYFVTQWQIVIMTSVMVLVLIWMFWMQDYRSRLGPDSSCSFRLNDEERTRYFTFLCFCHFNVVLVIFTSHVKPHETFSSDVKHKRVVLQNWDRHTGSETLPGVGRQQPEEQYESLCFDIKEEIKVKHQIKVTAESRTESWSRIRSINRNTEHVWPSADRCLHQYTDRASRTCTWSLIYHSYIQSVKSITSNHPWVIHTADD